MGLVSMRMRHKLQAGLIRRIHVHGRKIPDDRRQHDRARDGRAAQGGKASLPVRQGGFATRERTQSRVGQRRSGGAERGLHNQRPDRAPGEDGGGAGKHGALQPRDAERRAIVHGAAVRIRRLGYVPKSMLKVLGFVHSVESDASAILAVAEARLIEPNGDKQRRTGRTTLEEGR